VIGQLHVPAALHLWKDHVTRWISRLVGLQELVWMFWRKEKSLASAGIQTADHPINNLVTTPSLLFHCLIEIKTPSYWNYIFFFFISSKRPYCHTWLLKVKTIKQPFQLIHICFIYTLRCKLQNIITPQCQSWSCISAGMIFGKWCTLPMWRVTRLFNQC